MSVETISAFSIFKTFQTKVWWFMTRTRKLQFVTITNRGRYFPFWVSCFLWLNLFIAVASSFLSLSPSLLKNIKAKRKKGKNLSSLSVVDIKKRSSKVMTASFNYLLVSTEIHDASRMRRVFLHTELHEPFTILCFNALVYFRKDVHSLLKLKINSNFYNKSTQRKKIP